MNAILRLPSARGIGTQTLRSMSARLVALWLVTPFAVGLMVLSFVFPNPEWPLLVLWLAAIGVYMASWTVPHIRRAYLASGSLAIHCGWAFAAFGLGIAGTNLCDLGECSQPTGRPQLLALGLIILMLFALGTGIGTWVHGSRLRSRIYLALLAFALVIIASRRAATAWASEDVVGYVALSLLILAAYVCVITAWTRNDLFRTVWDCPSYPRFIEELRERLDGQPMAALAWGSSLIVLGLMWLWVLLTWLEVVGREFLPSEICSGPCLHWLVYPFASELRIPAIAVLLLVVYLLLALPVTGFAREIAANRGSLPRENTFRRLRLLAQLMPTAWLFFFVVALILGMLFFAPIRPLGVQNAVVVSAIRERFNSANPTQLQDQLVAAMHRARSAEEVAKSATAGDPTLGPVTAVTADFSERARTAWWSDGSIGYVGGHQVTVRDLVPVFEAVSGKSLSDDPSLMTDLRGLARLARGKRSEAGAALNADEVESDDAVLATELPAEVADGFSDTLWNLLTARVAREGTDAQAIAVYEAAGAARNASASRRASISQAPFAGHETYIGALLVMFVAIVVQWFVIIELPFWWGQSRWKQSEVARTEGNLDEFSSLTRPTTLIQQQPTPTRSTSVETWAAYLTAIQERRSVNDIPVHTFTSFGDLLGKIGRAGLSAAVGALLGPGAGHLFQGG